MNNVLITGSTGRLGKELIKFFPNALTPTRNELDVADSQKVDYYVKSHLPKIVIHLAAITDIRKCEENENLAWKTNVEGTLKIVKACEKFVSECYFVYMSTPCVFSGEEGNYNEDSIPHPKNFYGLTKCLAEMIVRSSNLTYLIVRSNFVPREKWPYEKAFTDRYGTYLFAEEVAKGIKDVLDERLTGIVHIVGDKKISMFELARITTPDVQQTTLKEYHGPPLTRDMSLDTIRWKKYMINVLKR